MKLHPRIFAIVLAGLALTGGSFCRESLAQDASSAAVPRGGTIGSSMTLYLYAAYHGSLGSPTNIAGNSKLFYQANGNVYDAKNRVVGKLIDESGHDLTTSKMNEFWSVRLLDGTVVGTTDAPSSAANVRTLTLEPTGSGWEVLNQNRTAAPPSSGGDATTGFEVSKSIRSTVGGGLSENDQNTSTGSANYPNNQPATGALPAPNPPDIPGGATATNLPPGATSPSMP